MNSAIHDLRNSAALYKQLKRLFELPRVCSRCGATDAMLGQWYCRPCMSVMCGRRYALARAVQLGVLSLSAIPFKVKLSARFFRRRPAGMKKAGYLSLMGRKSDQAKRRWLEARGIPYHLWQSWLSSHRWHKQKGRPWLDTCWICRKDELQVLPDDSTR